MRMRRMALLGALAVWAGTAVWHATKPLPHGLRVSAPWHAVLPREIRFIADVTSADGYGRAVVSHAIFDEMLAIIAAANEYVIADFHLFDDADGAAADVADTGRALSHELSRALITRKQAASDLQILVITDPGSSSYSEALAPQLQEMRKAGITVVVTDLDSLRDANPLFSSVWRLAFAWWNESAWARRVSIRANQRGVLLADDGLGGLTGIVSSAQLHDASSRHSNVALRLSGAALEPLVASELAIARFSGWDGSIVRGGSAAVPMMRAGVTNASPPSLPGVGEAGVLGARVITEGAIRDAIVARLEAAVRGDAVYIAMFELAERDLIEALLDASARGVAVHLILDPNGEAFGRVRTGIPNRPAAGELVSGSRGAIKVRWYRTHGEQFHSKLVIVRGSDRLWLTAGAADLTRRDVQDYNLAANVAIEASLETGLAAQVLDYFESLWSNRAPFGIEYTADFEVYADPSALRYWQYRVMEATGMASF